MKSLLTWLYCFTGFAMLAAAPSDLSGSNAFGIYRIQDQRTQLDYAQLFLNYFHEKSVLEQGKVLAPVLVSHFSETEWAMKLQVEPAEDGCHNRICETFQLTVYKGGKKLQSIPIRPACLDSTLSSVEPQLNMTVESLPYSKYRVVSVPTGSPEEQAGIRRGDWYTVEKVDHARGKVTLKVHRKKKTFKASIPAKIITTFAINSPLSLEDLDCIFQSAAHAIQTAIDPEGSRKFKDKHLSTTRDLIRQRPEEKLVESSELLPGKYANFVCERPDPNRLTLISRHEKFAVPKCRLLIEKKSWIAGNGALLNPIYYSKAHVPHRLEKAKDVDEQLLDVVRLYTEPLYYKPAVALNYLQAGADYEQQGMNSAAFNQYRAAYNSIEVTHTSYAARLEMSQQAVAGMRRNLHAINRTDYAQLLIATEGILDVSLRETSNDRSYYNVADTVRQVCQHIEGQLKEMRSKKAWAIIGAVASAAAGGAMSGVSGMSEFGMDLATEYFITAADLLTNNSEVTYAIRSGIRSTTTSLDIDISAEDLDNEVLASDLIFLTNFIIALTTSDRPATIIKAVQKTFDPDSPMTKTLEDYNVDEEPLSKTNQRVLQFLKEVEFKVYSYDMRGLPVPAQYQFHAS